MDTANRRRRLELSASAWTSRAQLIQHMDDNFEVRRAAAKAEWQDGESVPMGRDDPGVSAAS